MAVAAERDALLERCEASSLEVEALSADVEKLDEERVHGERQSALDRWASTVWACIPLNPKH